MSVHASTLLRERDRDVATAISALPWPTSWKWPAPPGRLPDSRYHPEGTTQRDHVTRED